jgi:hypothetical protein
MAPQIAEANIKALYNGGLAKELVSAGLTQKSTEQNQRSNEQGIESSDSVYQANDIQHKALGITGVAPSYAREPEVDEVYKTVNGFKSAVDMINQARGKSGTERYLAVLDAIGQIKSTYGGAAGEREGITMGLNLSTSIQSAILSGDRDLLKDAARAWLGRAATDFDPVKAVDNNLHNLAKNIEAQVLNVKGNPKTALGNYYNGQPTLKPKEQRRIGDAGPNGSKWYKFPDGHTGWAK